MKLKRLPLRSEGNILYPLPADYLELTRDGARQARVNACRQWLIKDKHRIDRYIAAIRFFDDHYLHADYENDFDPLFYDEDPMPTPRFHFEIMKMWALNRFNLVIAPRGSGKSYMTAKDMMLRLVTRPTYSFIYATSTNDNAETMGNRVRGQLYDNQRLVDDFGPDWDGRLKPKQGEAPRSTKYFQLTNGSWFRAISAKSKQRGGRPRRYRLDDPEYDPSASTSMVMLRQYMEELIFKIAMPMVMRSDVGMDWTATFVSRRHYAWHAMQVQETPDGRKSAVDSRYDFWHRMIVPAAIENKETKEIDSCWPHMWPRDDKEKIRLGRPKDQVTLEGLEKRMGRNVFMSEYMAKPGEGDGSYFGSLNEDKHGWWYEEVDEYLATEPHKSTAKICWKRLGEEETTETFKVPLKQFLRDCTVFMTMDTSYTAKSDSDYKVATVFAVTSKNERFVLDTWAGQTVESVLIKNALLLADKWRVRTIHPEYVSRQVSLYQSLESIVATRANDLVGTQHLPKVVKLKRGIESKTAIIAALDLLFDHGKLKFPLFNRNKKPWRDMFAQIEEFNPEAENGGLQYDDLIDTVAMTTLVLRGRTPDRATQEKQILTPLQRMLNGEVTDDLGQPLAFQIDWHSVDKEDYDAIMSMRTEPTHGKSKV